jgi:hypothetical protein
MNKRITAETLAREILEHALQINKERQIIEEQMQAPMPKRRRKRASQPDPFVMVSAVPRRSTCGSIRGS